MGKENYHLIHLRAGLKQRSRKALVTITTFCASSCTILGSLRQEPRFAGLDFLNQSSLPTSQKTKHHPPWLHKLSQHNSFGFPFAFLSVTVTED